MKFTNVKLPKAAAAAVGALAVAGAVAGGALLYDAMGTEPAAAQETGADAVFMDRTMDSVRSCRRAGSVRSGVRPGRSQRRRHCQYGRVDVRGHLRRFPAGVHRQPSDGAHPAVGCRRRKKR